jgi:hypothetical protein
VDFSLERHAIAEYSGRKLRQARRWYVQTDRHWHSCPAARFGAERAVDHSRVRLDGPSLAIEQREAHMTATRISTIRTIGLTLGLALSISTVTTLSSFAFSSKARQMCTGDAFRLCSSEIPNIARITACMRRNKANVSQGCRAVMDQEDAAASKARVAATPVEQPAATRTKPVQAARVEQKPTTATPVEQSAATEAKPVQAAPFEQKPTTATPVEQPASTETKPVQAAPVEQRPTTATPVEVMPVEAKSAPKGKPAKLAQRKQKHRQQTVEQHIHREFRNIEWIIGFALSIPFYW